MELGLTCMARVITGTHHLISPYQYPPGQHYALTFGENQYQIVYGGAVIPNDSFLNQFGSAQAAYGISSQAAMVANMLAFPAGYGSQSIFYTSNHLTWSSVYNTGNAYPTPLSRIRTDRTLPSLGWTSAVADLTTAEELALNGTITYDGYYHATYANYAPLKIVSTQDWGIHFTDAFLEYIGQLDQIVITGISYGNYWTYEPIARAVSNPQEFWSCYNLVAPAHDGATCYVIITFIRYTGGTPVYEGGNVVPPTRIRNRTWILRTEANGTHSGNLSFVAGTDFGSSIDDFIAYAEADPTNSNRVYLMDASGSLYVMDWQAGTLTELPLTVTPYTGLSGNIPPNLGLLVSDYGTLLVPYEANDGTAFRIKRSADGGWTWSDYDLTSQMTAGLDGSFAVLTNVLAENKLIVALGRRFYFSTDDGLSWQFSHDILSETTSLVDVASY